jgi:hypothetical protein
VQRPDIAESEEEDDMKTRTAVGIAAMTWTFAAAAESGTSSKAATFNFDSDSAGRAPTKFTFARTKNLGKPGKWLVVALKDAPSAGNALGQLDEDDTGSRYPLTVTADSWPADVRVSVKCKAVSGDTDQACGVVFRYKDQDNYYITRSNVLEGNVRLYHVKNGVRTQFANWDGKVAGNVWHELTAEAQGDNLRVFFNGKKVIESNDKTFSAGGKVGLWTKADSVIYFDDLTISALKRR